MNKKNKQNIFKNKIILHAFAAIILSIFIVFGLYNWLKISVNPDEKITLPDLKGMTLQEAEEYLNTKGLIAVVIDSVYNKEAKPGEIINQDPAPDIPVKPGRKIYLTINKFQKPFMKMPNFIDLSLRQAQVLANTYDLKVVGVEYVPSSCKGCIVGQKYKNREIKPGEPVPFGAPIVLVAGMGNEGSVSLVPYVINMSLGEAVAVIQSKGFNLGAEIYDETVKNASDSLNAKVFKQQPTADGKTLFPMGESIAVIGSGTMGNGIVHVFAQHGFQVNMVDIKEEALQKAMSTISKNMDRQIAKDIITEQQKEEALKRITTYTSTQPAVENADLVVEAATENIDIKLEIFKNLDQWTPAHCILASNTSSISITKIASVTKRPGQVIGMHFMNPVPVMKLVEVIRGYATTDQVTATIMQLSEQLGKVPVEVNDYPGFVANRILMPMINEAIYTLYEGVAGVEEIDTVMKLGMAHPMGPLQLADFIGLDVCLSILIVMYQGFGNQKYAPCPLLVNMVTAGKLGVKTSEGFYVYTQGSKEMKVSPMFQK